jgi:hypothetical protein
VPFTGRPVIPQTLSKKTSTKFVLQHFRNKRILGAAFSIFLTSLKMLGQVKTRVFFQNQIVPLKITIFFRNFFIELDMT